MATVTLEQRVPATTDQIWHAVATTEGMARWQADEVKGVVAPHRSVEHRWPHLGVSIAVKVVEVRPKHRLTFALQSQELVVEVEAGRVVLEHRGLMPGDEAEGTAASWRVSLGLLRQYLQYHPGRQRRVTWLVRRIATTAQVLHAFGTDAHLLRSWLTRAGAIDAQGSEVALDLAWGSPLTGTVLANTPGRDLAISWSEQDQSALVLRTLPAPFAEHERLVLLGWSQWGESAVDENPIRGELEAALDRLRRALTSVGVS